MKLILSIVVIIVALLATLPAHTCLTNGNEMTDKPEVKVESLTYSYQITIDKQVFTITKSSSDDFTITVGKDVTHLERGKWYPFGKVEFDNAPFDVLFIRDNKGEKVKISVTAKPVDGIEYNGKAFSKKRKIGEKTWNQYFYKYTKGTSVFYEIFEAEGVDTNVKLFRQVEKFFKEQTKSEVE